MTNENIDKVATSSKMRFAFTYAHLHTLTEVAAKMVEVGIYADPSHPNHKEFVRAMRELAYHKNNCAEFINELKEIGKV